MPSWSTEEEDRANHHHLSDEEMIELGEQMKFAILAPPADMDARCVCGKEISYITVYLPENGPQEQVVHHCHCKLTEEEFAAVGRNNKKKD